MTFCGYLSVSHPELDGNPTCSICGAIMVPNRFSNPLKGRVLVEAWKCMSCGSDKPDVGPDRGGER